MPKYTGTNLPKPWKVSYPVSRFPLCLIIGIYEVPIILKARTPTNIHSPQSTFISILCVRKSSSRDIRALQSRHDRAESCFPESKTKTLPGVGVCISGRGRPSGSLFSARAPRPPHQSSPAGRFVELTDKPQTFGLLTHFHRIKVPRVPLISEREADKIREQCQKLFKTSKC